MELIQASDLVKVAKLDKLGGENTARVLMSLFQFDKINQLYAKHHHKDSTAFVHGVLNDTGIKYTIQKQDLNNIPKEGGFIIIANHPYGGVEGLILLDALSEIRPDVKIMANFLFNWIEPLKDKFFCVNPFETHKNVYSSFHGLKKAFHYVCSGHPLVIFPAGEVSAYQDDNKTITDRTWSNSIMRFIENAEVPVIPVYFHGNNSKLFYFMGRVHPLLRTVKIPSEILNKQNTNVNIRIGNAITVKEQKEFPDMVKYTRYLRARTYALKSSFESEHTRKIQSSGQFAPISKAIAKDLLALEIVSITPRYQLFQWQQYSVYCAPSVAIPRITAEIGRLRELTFREVGEGTKQSSDIDEFDSYYHQLFIWDSQCQQIAGGYRVGKGKDIIALYGIKGFYTQTLFRMNKDMLPVLSNAIELGRSFVVKEYQRKPMSLFMLWKGILSLLQKNDSYKFLIGPVSISNSYTKLSQEIIISYIKKYHFDHQLARMIKPKNPFVYKSSDIDTDILLERVPNFNKMDQIINDIDPGNPKMPVLLKKYLELGGKIAAFNIDAQFSNTVDGFLVLDLNMVKPEIIRALSKSLAV